VTERLAGLDPKSRIVLAQGENLPWQLTPGVASGVKSLDRAPEIHRAGRK
jgi:hypothetical protein